jgi:NADPH-dependent curcumin reductase CurA
MTQEIGTQVVLASRPQGKVQPENFRIESFTPHSPGAGEFSMRVDYLSLDPYMRGRMDDKKSYADALKIGEVMRGESISTILASQHPDYKEGDVVQCHTGWRTHALSSGEGVRKIGRSTVPVTTRLGVLGMPGFTAYAGIKAIGEPREGETVVVAAAAGPVGSLVGQMAKIVGARAVGIAGGKDKCLYLKDELGFDASVDYRAEDFREALGAACPNGIDVYFENVGGEIWQAVLPLLNQFARVPVSGLIAHYDESASADNTDHLPLTMRLILNQSIRVQGFINYDFVDEYYGKFMSDVTGWIEEGRVKYREDIVDGIENAPQAFIGMLAGKNFGKLLVRIRPGR